jgi:hypothetical protein
MAKPPARGRSNPALRLAGIRQVHTYLGVFIAPSVIFFAFSGSLQLFSLHEAHGRYKPPALIAALGDVHTDQALKLKSGPADDDDDKAMAAKDAAAHEVPPKTKTVLLKWFFLAVAIGLIVSTGLGLWMAMLHGRRRVLIWLLLIAGIIAPLAILLA